MKRKVKAEAGVSVRARIKQTQLISRMVGDPAEMPMPSDIPLSGSRALILLLVKYTDL